MQQQIPNHLPEGLLKRCYELSIMRAFTINYYYVTILDFEEINTGLRVWPHLD